VRHRPAAEGPPRRRPSASARRIRYSSVQFWIAPRIPDGTKRTMRMKIPPTHISQYWKIARYFTNSVLMSWRRYQ
jgi:hypothetical protein